MKKLTVILLGFLFSGCASHLYVGNAPFTDGDQQCTATAYWYKTDYIIGTKADRFLTVLSGGQRRSVEYKEDNGKIVYRGDRARDKKVIGTQPDSHKFLCGSVENLVELKDFSGDELVIRMECAAKTDALSTAKGYLPASASPYHFKVTKETLTSFTGKLPEPPDPPTCERMR